MSTENLIYNAFLDDLHDDWVAVAANGTPIARASTETAVRRAAPDAAHYLNAGMLAKHVDDIDGIGIAEAAPEPEQNPAAAGLEAVKAQSTFDHDGDGAEGGSATGDESTAHKGAVKRAARAKK